jgi:hypothetical protein
MKKGLFYGTVLIAIYLGVVYSTGSGTIITDGTAGATNVIAAFQGRSAATATVQK